MPLPEKYLCLESALAFAWFFTSGFINQSLAKNAALPCFVSVGFPTPESSVPSLETMAKPPSSQLFSD
jgi:hypothetical protein